MENYKENNMENYCLGISLLTFTTFIFFQLFLLKKYDKCKRIIQNNVLICEIVNEDNNENNDINHNTENNDNNDNNDNNHDNYYYQDILIII